MNNIRKIIEERLDNDLTQEEVDIYTSLLNLIPTPRTEADILNDFEKLGWTPIRNDEGSLVLRKFDTVISILKLSKTYYCCIPSLNERRVSIEMQEHKLLNELFEVIF